MRLNSTSDLQPENIPSAGDASYQSVQVDEDSADKPSTSLADEADDAAEQALRQIRNMRESSEMENRRKNNYEDRAPIADKTELHSWPVSHHLSTQCRQ